ncbi:MAG: hypothetical protein HUU02_07765, partial [Bacteroidetes bacterium]|nr:hypothetical protein [Bacteroidota bacterium]
PVTEPLTEDSADQRADAMHPILLQDEHHRFSTALRLFGRRRTKVVFCLRIYFRLPVTAQDVHRFFDRVEIRHRTTLAERLLTMNDDVRELDTFNAVAAVMNMQEQNATTGSSLRRWTLDHLARTIALMNGEPPVRSHTKETIKLLLEEVTP